MSVIENKQHQSTRRALTRSQRWAQATNELPIIALANAGPVDMSVWSNETHEEVRMWACGDRLELPSALAEYLLRVRALDRRESMQ